ncbi:MAG: TonB-dependent receptor [Candidatus Calescibacterium sp.]|nr:TonB-dependent receptor [Candidatus Calescibacterium sp.]MCX7971789.1 TonB-dependent receptor [bacterium]MDW8195395.1 TonB-dependent receptor [Candidatus Calescibacterium sp.]
MKGLILLIVFFGLIISIVFGEDDFEEADFLRQELDFSFRVQGLSKYSKSILDSPAFISIVFPIELRLFYYENISTLLNFSPGLYVVEDGTYWYLGSRGVQIPGSYNSRALFLINGFPTNNLIFGNPIYHPTQMINYVEIVNGYSNVYSGSNSLVATVNFIPYFTDERNEKFELRHTYYFYSNKTGSNTFARYMLTEDPYLDFGIHFYSYPGRTIFLPQRKEFSIDDDNMYTSHYHVFGKISENTSFYFSNSSSRYHFPLGSFGMTLNDRNDFLYENSTYLYFKNSINLSSFSGLSLNMYYQSYKEHAEYPTLDQGFINIDDFRSRMYSVDINYYGIGRNSELVVGLEYRNISYSLRNFDVNYFSREFLTENLNKKRTGLPIFSVYSSYDYRFGNRGDRYWLFSISLRYDSYFDLYDNFKSIFVPQFAVIRVDGDKALKFVYSQNYRAPSIGEAFYDDGGISILSNPNLKPERHRTFETIYYTEIKDRNRFGYFSFSLYHMDISDLINNVVVGTNNLGIEVSQYRNTADVRVLGSMLDYALYHRDREFIRISYSYANARSINYFSFLSNSPKHLLLLKYGKRIAENLWFSVENKWTSSVFDDYGNIVKGFNITNINLIYEFRNGGKIGLTMYNVFDIKANYVVSLSNNYPVSLYPVKQRTIYLNFDLKL